MSLNSLFFVAEMASGTGACGDVAGASPIFSLAMAVIPLTTGKRS
jgi:hypothetical protein